MAVVATLLPALRAARRPGPPIATSFTDAVATRVVEAIRGPDRTAPPEAARTLARLERLQDARSEEHTSELQSLMRISYAVFCLKKKNNKLSKCLNRIDR